MRLRRFSFCPDSQENVTPASHRLPDAHQHLADEFRREKNVRPRAELDHPIPLARPDRLAGPQPADDPPGDRAGDLLDADRAAERVVLKIDPQLLVPLRATLVP